MFRWILLLSVCALIISCWVKPATSDTLYCNKDLVSNQKMVIIGYHFYEKTYINKIYTPKHYNIEILVYKRDDEERFFLIFLINNCMVKQQLLSDKEYNFFKEKYIGKGV